MNVIAVAAYGQRVVLRIVLMNPSASCTVSFLGKTGKSWLSGCALKGTLKKSRKLLYSACTSMCRHIYDWIIVDADVKQQLLPKVSLTSFVHVRHFAMTITKIVYIVIGVPIRHIDQRPSYIFELILVHGSHLKRKKIADTKSLGITHPYLVRQHVNTPLICQIRGDITMSFRCDHALKQSVHGFSSFHFDMAPRLRLGTISRGTWKPWTY